MKKSIFICFMIFILNSSFGDEKDYIYKPGAPQEITEQMVAIQVEYLNYDGDSAIGTLIVNKKIAKEVTEIFKEIKKLDFPIEKIIPISEYEWDDDKSMEDNNTSSYNYRVVANTKKLSNHSFGMAIDINPRYNPMITKGKISPKNGSYSVKNKGTITADSEIVKIFKKRGWNWGGDYKTLKDYQHFDKTIK